MRTRISLVLILLSKKFSDAFHLNYKRGTRIPSIYSAKQRLSLSANKNPFISVDFDGNNKKFSTSTLLSSSIESPPAQSATEEDKIDDEETSGLGAWIAIASAKGLYGLGPTEITVMGQRLVVWHDESLNTDKKKKKKIKGLEASDAKWSVMYDYCPHRLAPLSQGRVDPETNCIECPYHGWQFDQDGTVTSIPQSETGKYPSAANGKALPVHLVGDLIFAFLPSSIHGEMNSISDLPEDTNMWLPGLAATNKTYFVRELPYSADFLLENFIDPAHIPFAHHGLQGKREDGSPLQMKTLEYNFTHVEVLFGDKISNKERVGVLSFQRPCFYHFRTERNDTIAMNGFTGINSVEETLDYRVNLGIFVVPISAGKCRVLFQNVLPAKIPAWLAHAGSNRFLNTDTWLHEAEIEARRRSEDSEDYVYASKSDYAPNTFRKWWREFGYSKAPQNTFGPSTASQLRKEPMSRREQIDPWENHAKFCSTCRNALKRMKQVQVGALVFAIASLLFFPVSNPAKYGVFRKVTSLVGATFGFWLRNFVKKTATVIEGNPIRSEIDDRSVAAMS